MQGTHKTITNTYGVVVNFDDDRFKFIPGDIREVLDEIIALQPLLSAIAEGKVDPQELPLSLSSIQSHLWHLIDHANSLKGAIEVFEEEHFGRE